MSRNINILIIGTINNNLSTGVFLKKLLKILSPLVNDISLICGELPTEFIGKVECIQPSKTEKFKILKGNIITNYILNQILILTYILKYSLYKKYDLAIFIYNYPIPIMFSKILRMSTACYQGGTILRQSSFLNNNFLIRYFLYVIQVALPSAISDKIIIESNNCKRFQYLEAYENKIVVSPLFVDLKLFAIKNDLINRECVIGYIGNLDNNKGVSQFCSALLNMNNIFLNFNLRVLIIGDGPSYEDLKNILTKSVFDDRISFMGWVSHEIIPKYLNELKLLILPSNSEGLPNIVLEAMACGTPVLATPVGGIPDIINDEVTGFIMANNSPECIASNIVRALKHPDLDEIARSARILVERKYSYEAATVRWSELLDEICLDI